MVNDNQQSRQTTPTPKPRPADVIPTLFVGLGGQGRRIAENLKVRLEERYESVPGKYDDHIKFFCADTNVHERFGASFPSDPNRTPLELTGDELFSLANTPIEDLRSGQHPLGRLLPAELYSDQIYQGAQQIRRLGRVSLLDHYTDFRTKLKAIITALLQPNKNPPADGLQRLDDKRLQVYIVCSICGGTGSGTFIDTAYIMRDIMRDFKSVATNVIGVFLLPEVFNITGIARTRIRANAYAALLDLEYFNQPVQIGDPLYVVDLGEAGKLTSHSEPFSQCYLVQGNERYSEISQIAQIIGDALETLICTEIGGKIDAVQDNIRPQFTRYPNGFRTFYSAFGIERIIIPELRLRRLRANQDMRILIRNFILGSRRWASADNKTHAPDDYTFDGQDYWDDLRDILKNMLVKERRNQGGITVTLASPEGVRNMTEALDLVRAEFDHSPDLRMTLQQACDETEMRLFALSTLRQEVQDSFNERSKTWLRETLQALLDYSWRNGGGIMWLRTWLAELEQCALKERAALAQPLSEHRNQLGEMTLFMRNQLDRIDSVSRQRGIRGLFASRIPQARESANEIKHRFADTWENERNTLLDAVYATVLADIRQWQQRLGEIAAQWRGTLLQLQAEEGQTLRFDAEQAQVLIPKGLEQEVLTNDVLPADVEQKVKQFSRYLSQQRNMRAGFAATLFNEVDGSTWIEDHLRTWAYQPQAVTDADTVLNLIRAQDTDTQRRRWLSLLNNAKPLLNYAPAKLEVPPERIAYVNTIRLDKQKLPAGYGDINEVETNDPFTLTLLITDHAIPFDSLDHFEDYKDAYRKSLRGANPIFHLTNELENEPFDPSSRYFINPRERARHFALALALGAINEQADQLFDLNRLKDSLERAKRALRESVQKEQIDNSSADIDIMKIKQYQHDLKQSIASERVTWNIAERRFLQFEDRIATLDAPIETLFMFKAPFEQLYDECTQYSKDSPDRLTIFRRAVDLYRDNIIKGDSEQSILRTRYNKFLSLRIRQDPQAQGVFTAEDWTEERFEPIYDRTDPRLSALELRLCRHVLAELRQLNRGLWSSAKTSQAGYWLDPSYRNNQG